jgi:cobyrinic acid a,c-diamide synthase
MNPMSYLYLSAAHKSSGKTTLSIGLCAALRERGRIVQPFKKGPDYIDPLWLSNAADRSCINLDFNTMGHDEIREVFARYMGGADIGVIEGNKGLYDGVALDGSDSNAAMAALLRAPVILVIDTQGITRGIAPLLLGYQAFAEDINIAGVILNRVAGERHEGKLRAVVEHYTDFPVLGAVGNDRDLVIEERHLGLVPSNEAGEARRQIERLRHAVAEQVDLQRIEEFAGNTPAIEPPSVPTATVAAESKIRIGYARDRAFGFYYPDDLQAMEAEGAELVPFDTLKDERLPEVDGLFLGGGFPEMAMQSLEANSTLRYDIRQFIEEGGPVYAECGGLMYLARSLTWKGNSCKMVGVIPGDAVMHERPQGRGYVRLRETGNGPWPAAAGEEREIPAHEFHYSSLENLGDDITYAYEVLRGVGVDGEHDGIVYKNMLANYTHMRAVGDNHWTSRFLAHVRNIRYKPGNQ